MKLSDYHSTRQAFSESDCHTVFQIHYGSPLILLLGDVF